MSSISLKFKTMAVEINNCDIMVYEIDQTKVFFKCNLCEHVFQEDPDALVKCPLCETENVSRT